MPDQPNNAPTDLPAPTDLLADARDDATAARAMADTSDTVPGGGGLMGADADAGTGGMTGGPSPNSPSPDALPARSAAADDAAASDEARLRATDAGRGDDGTGEAMG